LAEAASPTAGGWYGSRQRNQAPREQIKKESDSWVPLGRRGRGALGHAVGALVKVRGRSGRTTTSAKSEGGAYSKAVGLGVGALAALIMVLLSDWLLFEEEEKKRPPPSLRDRKKEA
jgi:hypothetical protein